MAYDKAKWHFTDEFPSDLDEEQIYVHTGFYVGWVIERNLYSDDFSELNKADIRKFREKEITAPKLFENQGGVLSDDELNDLGRLFTNYYYENLYFDDYRKLFVKGGLFKKGLPSDYHVQNSWKNYQKAFDKISERFNEWQEFSEEKKLKYKKTFDFDKYGINDNSRAINEYFVEKYLHQLESDGFKYIKTKEVFTRNQKNRKESFGIDIEYRGGGLGHTIFPSFGIYNKRIEKIYKTYVKGLEYIDTARPSIIYSSHKISQDNEHWGNIWSPRGDETKVDGILELVMQFLETDGKPFFEECNSFEEISNLLLKHQPMEIGHSYKPVLVYERIIKGLIASSLNKEENTLELIEKFKPFIYDHYSKGKWAYDEDVKSVFDNVVNDILNNKIE